MACRSHLIIKKIMTKIFNWILWSSENSDKISLTLRAGIPFLVLLGVKDVASINLAIGTLGQTIVALAQFFTGVVALFGLVRKIYNSYN